MVTVLQSPRRQDNHVLWNRNGWPVIEVLIAIALFLRSVHSLWKGLGRLTTLILLGQARVAPRGRVLCSVGKAEVFSHVGVQG
jgi:hypothetical protein